MLVITKSREFSFLLSIVWDSPTGILGEKCLLDMIQAEFCFLPLLLEIKSTPQEIGIAKKCAV